MKKESLTLQILMILSICLSIVLLTSIIFSILDIIFANNIVVKQVIDILTISFISIFIIMNTTLSLFIMINKWISNWCIENKLLWGLLNLIVLSFIAGLVFSIKGKKYCNTENTNEESLYFQFVKEPNENLEEIKNNLDGVSNYFYKKDYLLLNKFSIISFNQIFLFSIILILFIISFSVNLSIYNNFIWILLIIFSLFFIIINLVVCMTIMIKKWENKWTIKNRIAYSFLSLFILSFSGILIFSLKAIKNCKDENDDDLDANGFIEEPFDIKVFSESDLNDDE